MLFNFLFIFLHGISYSEKLISVQLEKSDCKSLVEVEKASQNRVRLDQNPSNNSCDIRLDPSNFHKSDNLIKGFGGSMILVIQDGSALNSLRRFLGKKNKFESAKAIKAASSNEKLFHLPVFKISCPPRENFCEIIMSPAP